MDPTHGYERIAPAFIDYRGRHPNGTGAETVGTWALAFPAATAVLDLGCGTGLPVTKALVDAGLDVYGIDASPTMIAAFRQNFPAIPVVCESVVDSPFFDRTFDAILAWGLVFLLSEADQRTLIEQIGNALRPGGRLLFTAPWQAGEWEDLMTGETSRSLGETRYRELLTTAGFTEIKGFEAAGNHYFEAVMG